MLRTRAIVLALVVSILAGATAAALAHADGGPITVTVPVAAVGDTATYATEEIEGERIGAESLRQAVTYRVELGLPLTDKQGNLHETLRVVREGTLGFAGHQTLGAITTTSCDANTGRCYILGVAAPPRIMQETEFISLHTRDTLRSSTELEREFQWSAAYGRDRGHAKQWFNETRSKIPDLASVRWQGTTLVEGRELVIDRPLDAYGAWSLGEGRAYDDFGFDLNPLHWPTFEADEVRSITYSEQVGSGARIGTNTVLPVQTVARIEFAESPTIKQFVTYWMGTESPWPVLIESRAEGISEHDVGFRAWPASTTNGTVPVQWGAAPMPTIGAEYGRSSGTHPEDGVGSTIAHPLEGAMSLVAENRPYAFLEWERENPRATVVGYLYETNVTASRWRFLWATVSQTSDGRDAFGVDVEYQSGEPRIVARGPEPAPDLAASDLAPNPITLGGAESLWRGAVLGAAAGPVNAAHWGYWGQDWRRPDPSGEGLCVDAGPIERGSLVGNSDGNDPLRYLQIGRRQFTHCDEGVRPTLLASSAWIDVRTGTVMGSTVSQVDFGTGQQPNGMTPGNAPRIHDSNGDPVVIGLKVSVVAFAVFLAVQLLATLKPLTVPVIAIEGFTKLRRSSLLDQSKRAQIYDLVRLDPGLTLSDIVKRVGFGWGTTVHHLNQLQQHGLVTSLRDGLHRRHFPAELRDQNTMRRMSALQHDRTRLLLELIVENPGLRQTDLVQKTGSTRASVVRSLERLQLANLVERWGEGSSVRYRARPEGVAGLATPHEG